MQDAATNRRAMTASRWRLFWWLTSMALAALIIAFVIRQPSDWSMSHAPHAQPTVSPSNDRPLDDASSVREPQNHEAPLTPAAATASELRAREAAEAAAVAASRAAQEAESLARQ